MSKIYEALRNIQGKVLEGPSEAAPFRPRVIPSSPESSELLMEREIGVYQNLSAVLPDSGRKIIQFIGSREGEGTSTVVREFAKVSALKFGKLVLLLDADHRHPSQQLFFDIEPKHGWQDAVQDNTLIERALYQIMDTRLYLCPSSQNPGTPSQIFSPLQMDVFLEKLRQRFDLVLVDSQPATLSTDGLALSSKVDGVVLVVEAEKTRWPVAQAAKENILRNGGKILGIVLNKRRYYIPGWIYRSL